MNVGSVIVRPIVTEKSMKQGDENKFSFLVTRGAHKDVIKNAIEEAFNVHVVDVATTIVKGKTQRYGMKRREKKLSPWKKAIVTLVKGEKINVFDAGETK